MIIYSAATASSSTADDAFKPKVKLHLRRKEAYTRDTAPPPPVQKRDE